tara:strand:+ start:501 stop:632 length:132 start_codon:yes stop_codon:yes gene_type:complete
MGMRSRRRRGAESFAGTYLTAAFARNARIKKAAGKTSLITLGG